MASYVPHNDSDEDSSTNRFNKSRRRSETVSIAPHGTEFDRNSHRKLTQSNSSSSEPRPSTENTARDPRSAIDPDINHHAIRRTSIHEMADEGDEVPRDGLAGYIPRAPEQQTEQRPFSGKNRRRSDAKTDRSSDTATPVDLHIDLQDLQLETADTEIIDTEHPRYGRPKSSKGRQRGERVQDNTRYNHGDGSTNQQPAAGSNDPVNNSRKYKEEAEDNDHDPLSLTSSSECDDTERESETKRFERPTSSKIRQRPELTPEDLLVDGGIMTTDSILDGRTSREDDPRQSVQSRQERPKSGWDSNLRRRRVAVPTEDNEDLDIDLEIIAFHSNNDYVAACQVIDIGNTNKSSYVPPKLDTPGWNSKISPFTPRAWNANSDHPGTTTKTSGNFGGDGNRDDNRYETLDRVASFSMTNGDDSSTEGSGSGRSDTEQLFAAANKTSSFSGYEYDEVRGKVLEKYRRASEVNVGPLLPSVHTHTRNYLPQRKSQPSSNAFSNGRPTYSNQAPTEGPRRGPIRLHKLEPTCRVSKHSLDKTIKPTKHNGSKLTNGQMKSAKDEIKPGHKLRPLVGKRAKALIQGNDPNERILPKNILIPVVSEKPKMEINLSLKPNGNHATNKSVSKSVVYPPKYTRSSRDPLSDQIAPFTGDKSYDPPIYNESTLEDANYQYQTDDVTDGKPATITSGMIPAKHHRSSSFGHQSTYHDQKVLATYNSHQARNEHSVKANSAGNIPSRPILETDETEQNSSSVNAQSEDYGKAKGVSSNATYRKNNEHLDENISSGNENGRNDIESNQNKRSESDPFYNESLTNGRSRTKFVSGQAPETSGTNDSEHSATHDLDANNWAGYETSQDDQRLGDNARPPWGQQSLADLWQETQKMC